MSGLESLAQVNREIEAPKLKNLRRARLLIFLFSMIMTTSISLLAVALIPDGKRVSTQIVKNGHEPKILKADYQEIDYARQRVVDGKEQLYGYVLTDDPTDAARTIVKQDTAHEVIVHPESEHVERDNGGYRDNLINGLVQYLAGPAWLRIITEMFVVGVGSLILAGAVNTSMIGSNGVLNRLAEDGVLTPWFLQPQPRFGTTYRLISMIAILQLVTIFASWGDVNKLGEEYAFGVVWAFVFNTLAMVVLRFKDKSPRAYLVPLNIRIRAKNAPLIPQDRIPEIAGSGMPRMANEPLTMAVAADGDAPKPAINKGTVALQAHQQNQIDLPIGIMLVFLVLLSTAMINLATKKTATIWGIGFTSAFPGGVYHR